MANGNERYLERAQMSWINGNTFTTPVFQRYRQLNQGLDWENWNDPAVKQKNVEIMRKRSSLHLEIGARKGGWIFPEKIYLDNPAYMSRAPEHIDAIDRLILEQPMCHSLRVRFDDLTQSLIPKYIEEGLSKKDSLRVASFGAGTGRDIMTVMTRYHQITADLYDIDESALSVGRDIARTMGMEDRVNFYPQDLTKIQQREYDLGLLIGIICPLEDKTARIVLKAVKRNLSDTAPLIVSSSSDKMRYEDPLSRFLIEYSADWFLEFRDAARMEEVIRSADLAVIENTQESSGFNRLAVCRKTN